LVATLLSGLTQHLYIFGTAGEGYAVNEQQFDEISQVFRQATRQPDVQAMVGIITLSLSTIIQRIERAREMGFRHFQISLPSWGALTDQEIATFFRETCDRFPDCSFLHYNLPRAKRMVTPEEYGLLASRHANLIATKHGGDSMNQCLGLFEKAPELQHFFTETAYGYASLTNPCGFLVSVASMNFIAARRYFEAGQKRETATLSKMQWELNSLTRDLAALGTADAHMDGAFDKVFCKLHDSRFPLRLLPPYAGLKEETFQKIADLVREKYPRWLPASS
jgi:dihydrodipicolinate synthase/N-acetylneuraminate lyase